MPFYKNHLNLFLRILTCLSTALSFAQSQGFLGVPQFNPLSLTQSLPKGIVSEATVNRHQPINPPSMYPQLDSNVKRQNQEIMKTAEQNESIRMQHLQNDNQEHISIHYNLPSHSKQAGTQYYVDTFNKMLSIDPDNYSIKDINFQIENAFTGNTESKAEFDKTIQETSRFLKAKMKELGYDENSNLAKNYILFQFFSETMQLKATAQKHFPLKYDFNDYTGTKDWSKMFVTKLIQSGTGQCHSMPLLYLILAEEIGAKSYLAFSPNHSYIKFQDGKDKWYNLELTNGMFTTDSFILNSGFIKSEALQNGIYMQTLSERQLLSQLYTDLAAGYLHKYGYDRFVEIAVNKALELYPNNINANKLLSNYYTELFLYVTKQLDINPEKREQLVQIRDNPDAMAILMATQKQYELIDASGFEYMPAEAYERWLSSLNNEKSKQENKAVSKQFKGLIKSKPKN